MLAICVDEEGDKFLVCINFICCIEKRIVLLLFIYEIIINQCVSTALKTRECIRPTGLKNLNIQNRNGSLGSL